jgi:type I restriction enzyme S subunit
MESKTFFNLFENFQVGFLVNSLNVVAGDMRLDSSHFVDDSNIVLNCKIQFRPLIDLIDGVEEPKLFTRIYCDEKYGLPYISSSEMSQIEPPVNSRFISKTLTSNINQYKIKRGQILVSAAGTVGSIVLATKELDGVAGTSDILRINVDAKTNLGFVYTYLTSSFGANELANLAYGAIIKRIRGFQLSDLKTPIIDNDNKLKMNELVLAALDNRDKANILIKQSRQLVLKYNNLPELLQIKKQSLFRITNLSEFTDDYRLDSHFYNPMAEEAAQNIQNCSYEFRKLKDDIIEKIYYLNRFTRTFVEKGFGIPYMAGKDIIKIRPTDVSYLSSSVTQGLDDYRLKRGWILMTCSGTSSGSLGSTCLIHKNYENWVGTHDLIRIVSKHDFDSGYLYAFLSSDYGYYQTLRYKHGAVIDHLTPEQVAEILIPIPSKVQQNQIGDLVRQAYDLRAEAIRLEDEAQALLTQALTKE